MKYSYTELGLKEGDFVKSSVEDLGQLPESFSVLSDASNSFFYGIGLRITPKELVLDPDLSRFFAFFGTDVWDPTKLTTDKDKAIKDIFDQVAGDYRKGGLLQAFPDAPHQIYGEIRRNKLGDPKEPYSKYDNRLEHLDFVPPEIPCFGFFFADQSPTRYTTGEIEYRGTMRENYRDADMRTGKTPVPPVRSAEDFPARHLHRTKDARTLLHQAPTDFQKGDMRTFGRLFVGPIPFSTTLQNK